MSQKTLSKLLKVMLVILSFCALCVYVVFTLSLVFAQEQELIEMRVHWLIIILATAIPVCFAVYYAFLTAANIGKDKSFSQENAKNLGRIALLAAIDSAWLAICNVVMIFFNMHHPGVFIVLTGVIVIGSAISAAAACLSHLVKKAASLQEQSDLTI